MIHNRANIRTLEFKQTNNNNNNEIPQCKKRSARTDAQSASGNGKKHTHTQTSYTRVEWQYEQNRVHALISWEFGRTISATESEKKTHFRGIAKPRPLFLKIAKLYKCYILLVFFFFPLHFNIHSPGNRKQYEITKTRIRHRNETAIKMQNVRKELPQREMRENTIYYLEFTSHCIISDAVCAFTSTETSTFGHFRLYFVALKAFKWNDSCFLQLANMEIISQIHKSPYHIFVQRSSMKNETSAWFGC